MELVALVIGMALAFVLGAYVRQPWAIMPPRRKIAPQAPEIAITKDDDDVTAEEKHMAQIKNMWNYTGKEQDRGY